jgi:hypothetical protein
MPKDIFIEVTINKMPAWKLAVIQLVKVFSVPAAVRLMCRWTYYRIGSGSWKPLN